AAGPRNIATALVKAQASVSVWAHTRNVIRLAELNRHPVANAAAEFVKWMDEPLNDARFDRLLEQHQSHPIDSHPALAERLAALEVDRHAAAQGVVPMRPTFPFIELFDDAEELEIRLTERLREEVVADIR